MDNIRQEDIYDICFNISSNLILPKYQSLNEDDIKYKNGKDLVTSVDIAVEKALRKNLLKLLPFSNFVGEEEYAINENILKSYHDSSYCWTVDPIDGTSNYVKGREKFAIMIALTLKEKILYSWIYKPIENIMCYAIYNEGAFIDNNKILTKSVDKLDNAIGSISTKYWNDNDWQQIQNLKNEFAQINSYRCIGYEYIEIGEGKRNFAILSKLSPWDHIPGILFVRESGGSDIDFDNNQYDFTKKNKNLIVGNSKEFNLQILNKLGV